MIDPQLLSLIPHRPPMLLLTRAVVVSNNASVAEIDISTESSFFVAGKGVPAWIGVEYMGQTAAMIAGFQLQQGEVEPHVGLLLGTRKYQTKVAWFCESETLQVTCKELAVVGQNLATFLCEINSKQTGELYASAKLSVFRRALQS